jgi:hypothetical protein
MALEAVKVKDLNMKGTMIQFIKSTGGEFHGKEEGSKEEAVIRYHI